MAENEVTTIPRFTRVLKTTFALLPATGNREEDLAYCTDTLRLYRWSGAAWEAVTPDMSAYGNAKSNSGNYAGNDSANRAVAHGLGVIPKLVIIYHATNDHYIFHLIAGLDKIFYSAWNAVNNIEQGNYAVTAKTNTNFYVGNAASYPNSANANASTYYWVAIG